MADDTTTTADTEREGGLTEDSIVLLPPRQRETRHSTEGKSMPIRAGFDLRVTGAPGALELWQGEVRLANAAAAGDYRFRGLPRGQYSLKAGGKE